VKYSSKIAWAQLRTVRRTGADIFTGAAELEAGVDNDKKHVVLCGVGGQIFESTGRCVTMSIPAASTIVCSKYGKLGGDSSALRQLTRDVVRWQCRPYPTLQPPPLAYVLKFLARPACIAAMPMIK